MVTVTGSRLHQCIWCCQRREGVDAEFRDGLRGFLCWSDFRRAVKARTNSGGGPSHASGQRDKAPAATVAERN